MYLRVYPVIGVCYNQQCYQSHWTEHTIRHEGYSGPWHQFDIWNYLIFIWFEPLNLRESERETDRQRQRQPDSQTTRTRERGRDKARQRQRQRERARTKESTRETCRQGHVEFRLHHWRGVDLYSNLLGWEVKFRHRTQNNECVPGSTWSRHWVCLAAPTAALWRSVYGTYFGKTSDRPALQTYNVVPVITVYLHLVSVISIIFGIAIQHTVDPGSWDTVL